MSSQHRTIRPCDGADFDAMYEVINTAATAYAGVIPADRYHVPYLPAHDLHDEIAAGVRFWGWHDPEGLSGVMGIQDVDDVTLVRHAYVKPERQGAGIGSRLLAHLMSLPHQPLLVGTWADATPSPAMHAYPAGVSSGSSSRWGEREACPCSAWS